MKITGMLIACTIALTAALPALAYTKPDPVHSPNLVVLEGAWFLREADECTEVVLDRKGRSELLLENRDLYIDRNPDYLFLTIKRYPHTFTYRMNPVDWGQSYVLELVAIKPDTPPAKDTELKNIFTGIFRRMIDCQMTPAMQAGTLQERNIR